MVNSLQPVDLKKPHWFSFGESCRKQPGRDIGLHQFILEVQVGGVEDRRPAFCGGLSGRVFLAKEGPSIDRMISCGQQTKMYDTPCKKLLTFVRDSHESRLTLIQALLRGTTAWRAIE